jgi:hypothetical protein
MVPGQIHEFPPDLERPEAQKVNRRFRPHFLQGPDESVHRRLKYVIGFLESTEVRIPGEHAPRKSPKPVGRVFDQLVASRWIALSESSEESTEIVIRVGVGKKSHSHSSECRANSSRNHGRVET